jgi:hypothetical protein
MINSEQQRTIGERRRRIAIFRTSSTSIASSTSEEAFRKSSARLDECGYAKPFRCVYAPIHGDAMSSDILTVNEVADRLRVKASWVYSHAADLGAYRLGRYLRFSWIRVLERIEKIPSLEWQSQAQHGSRS